MVFKTGLLISLLVLASLAGCSTSDPPSDVIVGTSSPSPKQVSSVSVVRAVVEPVEVTAGKPAQLTVQLTIQPGYHVNANPPTYPYLIPTALDINNSEGLTAEPVSYPKAIKRKFVFAEKELDVYEGEVNLTTQLSAASSASKGERSVDAKLRIQACDEEVCYPPGAIDLKIPVRIN